MDKSSVFVPKNVEKLAVLFSRRVMIFLRLPKHTIKFLPIYHCNLPLRRKPVSQIPQKRNNTKTKNTFCSLFHLYWETHYKEV